MSIIYYTKSGFVVILKLLTYNSPGGKRMQYSTRLAVAVHILVAVDYFKDMQKVTSDFLAASINVNPVIVRKSFSQLKKAGLIKVARGPGGAVLAKDPSEITMLDVYRATEEDEKPIFHMHDDPNPDCPVGRNIHAVLEEKWKGIKPAVEKELEGITLADTIEELHKQLAAEEK